MEMNQHFGVFGKPNESILIPNGTLATNDVTYGTGKSYCTLRTLSGVCRQFKLAASFPDVRRTLRVEYN